MISFHWLADPPWPPGKPVVKDIGRTSLMLNWTKPEHDGGAKIDSYVIEMLKTGTEDWVRVAEGVPTTQHLLPGLMEGQEYKSSSAAEEHISGFRSYHNCK